jgi:hypothetical protein
LSTGGADGLLREDKELVGRQIFFADLDPVDAGLDRGVNFG